jgi:uroporphyrinogen-III decarboxylase
MICSDLADYIIAQLPAIYEVCKPDFMVISEDMSYNNGPMLSEALFDEFLLPYYQRIIPEIKKYGTKVIVDTDGDVSMMIPWLKRAGVDGVLPLERQAGVDLVRLREMYPDFLFIGGFDKMTMSKGEDAMRAEFERLLPVMRSGGFIPSCDHQTPPGVSLENYRIYVRLLKEYAEKAVN